MLVSTLISKGKIRIPAQVRKALNLKPGDSMTFEIMNHQVVISKRETLDYEYYRALSHTLSEWGCKEDEKAYRYL